MSTDSRTKQRSRADGIFRTKSIESSIAETTEAEYQLKKRLSALDLTVFGIGVIIGAGIFPLTGRAGATGRRAWPAMILFTPAAAMVAAVEPGETISATSNAYDASTR